MIGIGAGNYELWWNQHHTIDVITIDAHSLYLQTLAELGIVGILLLLGFLGTALYAGWRAVARRPDVGDGGRGDGRGPRGVPRRPHLRGVRLDLAACRPPSLP